MSVALRISGMTCNHCQSAVQRALEAVPGVEKAEVNLQDGLATVHGSPDPAQLVEAVQEEGYGAEVAAI
ncbi:copper chaperone [Deinobacterium chartae]|uniref:Copper chaperone n=1 Tax=Deinobacterium chartae TaxID=521158 RepID=A0A841HZG8_9DEIO|nr:cation transporter [Deinobacterium chartae]MBB6098064.1 copper chaperone [Deinobacterium chartae]